ncbi:hypothetical protein ACGFZP_18895 [Kitasatospora sp. NPDC048239]|uniref:hypothetical protein n=1 Tax=Kitasatospora sp. NPDC048239 TaxID=3364046 RepID=UPI00370F8225
MTKPAQPTAVVYLCTTKDEPVVTRQAMCERIARESGLHLAGVIHDDEGATEPDQRRGLTYALQMLLDGDADTIIVPTGEMLSVLPDEKARVSRSVRKAGGRIIVASEVSARS